MNRIYKQMDLIQEQYNVGLISLLEYNAMMKQCSIALMGCDSL
jgi:hypothetical protein